MYYYIKIRRFFKNLIILHRLKKNYNIKLDLSNNTRQWIIYMCDGKRHHGGLADRLSGLVSTYDYCKQNNKVFKANYIYPYPLTSFLIPNKYDWRIDAKEISYNKRCSEPRYIPFKYDLIEQQAFARKMLQSDKKQLHAYTNMKYFFPCNFKHLFSELFKPSPYLQEAIDLELNNLPEEYISITFRFQQLLGDLEEGNFPKLEKEYEKEQLIKKCLKYIEKVHDSNPEIVKILVTSDSKTFLKRAKESYPYTYISTGEIVHVDFNTKKVDLSIHRKSFVDLFMIAKAKRIYSVVLPPLYHSGFPYLASMIYGNEYIEI